MTVQEHHINLNGIPTRFFQTGQDGLPLVLFHGTGESALDWSWVLPKLGERYRVYAPDLPGTGYGLKPIRDYSIELFTQFAKDFLDAIALDRVVIGGNSLGGLIALNIALARPEQVAGLILVDSTGLGEEVSPFLSSLTLPLFGEVAVAGCQTPVGAVMRSRSRAALQFAHPDQIPREWYAEQQQLAQNFGFLEATLSALRAQLTPTNQRTVMLESLPQLQMPTLLVWGEQDLIYPRTQAEEAVKHIPQGYLSIIPDCGHVAPLEKPDHFATVLDEFLSKLT
ncbi:MULTISPECIES: alpha/beta hydrolase [unclassified Leptolyngbya]|uniref:alpha/beta fold hydrolase n=1 Tax=unclassified Leptolyngbya TaxID=2650499 RepID=UPI001685B22A|nr:MULTISPECIES: alpha/beta hydrolase [unclassified Leptolyngbya]MBD1909033.1 alpha/beta hydrolase [Leptolyngbya sp. FACHB-8]MBD2153025.1 alpha/beta hydrolase [Leptolyngbya sp. FACHB-16]